MQIAIIGAGIAGLSCAQALQAAGHAVQVFDKSRGPAGRMSTRRGEGWQCDHGAQYFTARDAAFRAEVARWCEAGAAAVWSPKLAVFGPHTPSAAHDSDTERFVGTPRMNAPARLLADTLPLTLQTTVTTLAQAGRGWKLQCAESGWLDAVFDCVLLAVPAPQAAPILAPVAPALAATAQRARMRGAWSLMLRYESAPALHFDAAFVNHGPLRWVARDSAKPGRAGLETWLLHATAAWSETHIEAEPEWVAAQLLAAFEALGAPAPAAWTAHRWRYADTEPALPNVCEWDATARLGLCGDWLNGGKIEGAWLSGRALAKRVCGLG